MPIPLATLNTVGVGCGLRRDDYSEIQISMPLNLARLLPYITIGYCFDSYPHVIAWRFAKAGISLRTFEERDGECVV